MSPAQKLKLLFTVCSLAAAGLVAREGWELKAYPDPVHGNRVPTACAGVTEGVKVGKTYTEEECLLMTAQAMLKHTAPIFPCVRDDLQINPKSAQYLKEMANFAYNVGVPGFRKSTSCRQMLAGNYRAACDGILLWYKSGGIDCRDPNQRVCRGLWADRKHQHEQCVKALP